MMVLIESISELMCDEFHTSIHLSPNGFPVCCIFNLNLLQYTYILGTLHVIAKQTMLIIVLHSFAYWTVISPLLVYTYTYIVYIHIQNLSGCRLDLRNQLDFVEHISHKSKQPFLMYRQLLV